MKILIGYDGTPDAETIFEDLDRAGLPSVAEVCLLSAIPPVYPMRVLAMDPAGTAWLPVNSEAGDEKKRVDAALETGSRASQSLRARRPGWDVMMEARIGTPAESLLSFADTWKPDLIAVGSHGWSWLGRKFLGSTTEKIMAQAKANLRLCHPREHAAGAPPRILVAMDGSRDSRQAVDEVAGRDWPAGTSIRLLAVREYHPFTEAIAAAEAIGLPAIPLGFEDWKWMEDQLAETASWLKAKGLDVGSAILEGDPRHILLAEASSFKADCVFLGRRGLSRFKRYLLGSVSGAVASHAPCSVEIIRKPVDA